MKIIKQTESAGGLIFKQNSDGKAMKQNYNFGNAFSSDSVAGTVATKPQISLPQGQTYVFYVNFVLTPSITSCNLLYQDANNYVGIANAVGSYYVRGNGVSKLNPVSQFGASGFQIFIIDVVRKKIMLLKPGNTSGIEGNYTPSLGVSTNYTYGGTGQIASGGTKTRIDKVAVYDRAIGIDEAVYMYNNIQGNELLNRNGLLFETNNNCAILNSGVVSVIDESGNANHRPIINLPAGSDTDKLNYANQNLFKEW